MASLEDVYSKFGFASEVAQLLETQLGNILFMNGAIAADLIENQDPARAADLLSTVNKQTLGQLLKSLKRLDESLDELDTLLKSALSERNRLIHSFFREHNLRRSSADGRAIMMADLENIHDALFEAYMAVMRLSGFEVDKELDGERPTKHLPI